jgi:ATP-dependent Lhr-like helicase
VAFAISRSQHRDVELGISDNGFYLSYEKNVNVMNAFKLLKSEKFGLVLNAAIDRTEVLKRRFRHCASRALMILREYMGRRKRVGRQQVSSMLLLNAVKRISPDFSILKEARREVLEDLMDKEHATWVLKQIEAGKIKIKEINTSVPSPFSFNLVLEAHTDVLKIEDKIEFLRRMHRKVLEEIAVKSSK